MFRFNKYDNALAERLFKQAIDIDEKFSSAHSGLSFTHFQNAFVGFTKDAPAQRELSHKHANISFDLDPFDPFANLTMGRAQMLNGNYEESIPWFDRCLEFRPNYAFGIYTRGLVDAILGNGMESQRRSMKALSLSPLDPLLYAMLCCRGLSHLVRGEYDAASDWAERGAIRPNSHLQIWAIAAMSHELAGNHVSASKWVKKINESNRKFAPKHFLQSFPIRDPNTRSIVHESLTRLGF
jgi:tetratricopeptide (TPR) repeat protein